MIEVCTVHLKITPMSYNLKPIEKFLESLLFRTRWLLAPFYGGLVVTIMVLLVKFFQEFFHFLPMVLSTDMKGIILEILVLVDFTLLANLLLIIIFSGYETFVSKIDNLTHEDRPKWMGKVDFSELKIKLFGSIVAISGIELLKWVDVNFLRHSCCWTSSHQPI